MRVLVTGATGFVGSHLVEALVAQGHEVTCLARRPDRARQVFGPDRVRTVPGDLFDLPALARATASVEAIFHVAGAIAARRPQDFYRVNRDGTANLLAAARQAHAPSGGPLPRLIYVSSLSAAGPSRRGRPLREDSPPQPVSHYGRSKLAAEALVRASPLPWTIVRPPTVYGPRDPEVWRLFRLARLGALPVVGDPEQELSFIYAPDLAQALLAATQPGAAGRIYFACHPEVATLRQTLEIIFTATRGALDRPPSRPRLVRIPRTLTRGVLHLSAAAARLLGRPTLLSPDKGPELLAEAWTCSPQALERDTGWRAATDLAAGMARTAAWYAENGWL